MAEPNEVGFGLFSNIVVALKEGLVLTARCGRGLALRLLLGRVGALRERLVVARGVFKYDVLGRDCVLQSLASTTYCLVLQSRRLFGKGILGFAVARAARRFG